MSQAQVIQTHTNQAMQPNMQYAMPPTMPQAMAPNGVNSTYAAPPGGMLANQA